MLQHLYDEMERYITLLNECGYHSYATDIRNAKLGGVMASEIIVMVAVELEKAHQKLSSDQNYLIARADRLLDKIYEFERSRL